MNAMRHSFLGILLLFLSSSTAYADDRCTISQGMPQSAVRAALGAPDWTQPEDANAWAYFNSGIECLFKNDRLYAVRFTAGAPYLPPRLSSSNLVPGSRGRPVVGLGPIRDRSDKRWRTEMYSDQKTFALAANYSPLTSDLENVLLQEASFDIYCSPARSPASRNLFALWYGLGGAIEQSLRLHASGSASGLASLKTSLAKRLAGHGLNATGLPPAPFVCCDAAGSARTAALRDYLLKTAAAEGRRANSATPSIAFFTGMYLSLAKAVSLPPGSKTLGAYDEALNHFEGLPEQAFPFPEPAVVPFRTQFVSALRTHDAHKIQRAATAFAGSLSSLE